MDIILLDWTRMGRSYCLAGAVNQAGQIRIVRPMPARGRDGPVPNFGWSPYLLDGHARFEVFEMIKPRPGAGLAPHLEDVWVQTLRPRNQLADPDIRRAILQATLTQEARPFGCDLLPAHDARYLEPGTGRGSLASIVVPAAEVQFTALWRDGSGEPDVRVRLPLGPDRPILPLKDHFLLSRVESQPDLDERLSLLRSAVRRMGDRVVVRLGLSPPYASANGQPGRCWLMADGFFSPDNPQP
jgi:hypothetical protein